jgi:hypothetical protein
VAGKLPASLLDETGQTLNHVVRTRLPADRWPAVATAMHRVDNAVRAGEPAALRHELDQLRWVVQPPGPHRPTSAAQFGSTPPQMPSGAMSPQSAFPGYVAYAPPRRSFVRRWWWLIAAALGSVLVVVFAASIMMVGDSGNSISPTMDPTLTPDVPPTSRTTATLDQPPTSRTTATTGAPPTSRTATTGAPTTTRTGGPPTTSVAPPPTAESDGGSVVLVGVLVALAAVVAAVVVVVNIRRKQSRVSSHPGHGTTTAEPRPFVSPSLLMPAPREVVEFANRTVLSLAAHGGRP